MYKLYCEGKKVFLLDQEKKNKFVGHINDHLGKPQYIFSNCEIDDYNSKYDDFKDLMINRIPESILFCILIEDGGQIIENLKEVPYPFNYIELVKCDKYATINLSASTEGENWK